MRQFTGLESTFLSLETRTDHLHIGTLLLLNREDRPDAATFSKVCDLVESRIHQMKSLRRRLVEVPFGLDHPVWIEDPDFELDAHLHHIAVPGKGDASDLSKLVGHLLSIPLHRDRPLWEMYLIEGLENDQVAVLTKIHAAAIDRETGADLLVSLLDFQPEAKAASVLEHPWLPEREPNTVELLAQVAGSWVRNPLRIFDLAPQVIGSALNLRRALAERGRVRPGNSGRAPFTPFNGALTPQRAIAWETLSLADVKEIKNIMGTTVNDVVLSVVAGALRQYLLEVEALPEEPIVAMVPLSLIDEGVAHAKSRGHQEGVAPLFLSLATDTDDPVKRLKRLSASLQGSPMVQKAVSADMLQDVTRFAPPAVAARAARMYSRYRAADRQSPLFNVVVTNVPGPPFKLYFAGALVEHHYTAGPIFNAAGLSITLQSHGDKLDVTVLSCPKLVPDSWQLAQLFKPALEELFAISQEMKRDNKSVA